MNGDEIENSEPICVVLVYQSERNSDEMCIAAICSENPRFSFKEIKVIILKNRDLTKIIITVKVHFLHSVYCAQYRRLVEIVLGLL